MTDYGPHGRLADTWWGNTAPPTGPVGTANTWVAWRFGFQVPGRFAGARRYDDAGFDGGAIGFLLNNSQLRIESAWRWKLRASTAVKAWHNEHCHPWVRINTNDEYQLWVMFPGGHYFRQTNALPGGVVHNGIDLIGGAQSTLIWPVNVTLTWSGNANGIDILFYPD